MSSLTIAVIGSGVVGRALTSRLTEAKHTVTLGVRTPHDPDVAGFAAEIGAKITDINAAIAGADVVLLAINGAAMAEAVPTFGAHLDGKIVIDATNNIGATPLHSLTLISEHAPTSHLFRAFNNLGWENFTDAVFHGTPGDLLYCGPAGDAQQTVETVIAATGLRPIRVGDNDKAPIVDTLTGLWFSLAFEQGMGRGLGFKILTR